MLKENNWMAQKLRPHLGHKVVCVCYGDPADPADICVECEDCNEVLVSAEDFNEQDERVKTDPSDCEPGYEVMCARRRDGEITDDEFEAWFEKHCANCYYMSEVCMYGEE